jgi:hypothetical protein
LQTFVPYVDDALSARVLDDKRLNKQVVECAQILNALLDPAARGWVNHPAVKMWRGYEARLVVYTQAMQSERTRRYGKPINVTLREVPPTSSADDPPWWAGFIHSSHRSNLVRKDQGFYGRYNWPEDGSKPYFWPV